MRPHIVMLFGSPGSGKSTQARLLADKLGWLVVDTGQLIERIVQDPSKQRNPAIRREKARFDAGLMVDSKFAARHLLSRYRALYEAEHSIVVDGHAVPDQLKLVLPQVIKMFGRPRMRSYVLEVDQRVALMRNSRRKVCTFCARPLLTDYPALKNLPMCPVCGGKLYRRTLDKPAIIRERLEIYERDITASLAELRAQRIKVKKLDGGRAPAAVCMNMYDDLTD